MAGAPAVDLSAERFLTLARWALTITVAAAPLYVVRWRYGPLPTTLLENLIWLTVGLYLLGRRRSLAFRRTPLDLPIALLLVAGVISVLVAPNHRAALGIYRAFVIEPVVIYYVAVDLLRTSSDLRRLLVGMVAGGTVFAVLNLGAFAIATSRGPINLAAAPTFLYTSANSVAMFLEPMVALSLGFALFGRTRRERALAMAALALLVPATILSLSRGGFLAMAVLAIVVMASVRYRIPALVATLIAAGAVLRLPPVAERLAHQFDPHYPFSTFTGRTLIWESALRMLRDHPILGVGLMNYNAAVRPYVPPGGSLDAIYPHNIWLAFWSELGVLGLLAFTALYVAAVWLSWRNLERISQGLRPVLWGVFASFVLIGVHGLVDTPYWKNDLALEFWILAALLVASLRARDVSVARRDAVAQRAKPLRTLPASPTGTETLRDAQTSSAPQ